MEADLVAETVDDGVDPVEFLFQFAHSALVRLVALAQLVSLTLGALVRLRQLTDLTLDRLQTSTHRLHQSVNQSVNQSISLSVCQSVCLSVYIYLPN